MPSNFGSAILVRRHGIAAIATTAHVWQRGVNLSSVPCAGRGHGCRAFAPSSLRLVSTDWLKRAATGEIGGLTPGSASPKTTALCGPRGPALRFATRGFKPSLEA